MAEQTQIERVRRYIEENIMDVGYVRKCVDSDFIDTLIALLLNDDIHYSSRIYNVDDDWFIIHVWYPGSGGDWALAIKVVDGDLDECWYFETG